MSSGLAAVVLLVAAGAGILVVRRRTALAGYLIEMLGDSQ